jgi:translation initiation factor 3 subunit L
MSHSTLHPEVRDYLATFAACFANNSESGLAKCYDDFFGRMTERFFASQRWPSVDVVEDALPPLPEDIAADGNMFFLFYEELYHRHSLLRVPHSLTPADRTSAFETYVALIQEVSSSDFEAPVPTQWLWDIFDEFVYQFQTSAWSADNSSTAFSVDAVLDTLTEAAERQPFAKVALLHVYTLVSDFYSGVKAVEGIDLKVDLARHPAPHVALAYCQAVCLMMQKRFGEAARVMNGVLRERVLNQAFLQGNERLLKRGYRYEYVSRMCERMYGLLAIIQAIYPFKIDMETVHAVLRERHGETMGRMQRGDVQRVEEEFQKNAPKFVSLGGAGAAKDEALKRNARLFAAEVKQQVQFATIRSFLKLYSSISVAKLATFVECDEAALLQMLMAMKHKARALQGDGKHEKRELEVDFIVEDGMVRVSETRAVRQFGAHFVRQIIKFGYGAKKV